MQRSLRGRRIVPAGLIVAAAVLATPAAASPESQQYIGTGIDALRTGQFDRALADFDRAGAADRNDLRAVFYQGYALNRLGQFAPGYEALTRARAAGLRHPELDIELGWAALETGRLPDAAERLESYERATPGNARAALFLGRTYLGLGQPDRAETMLRVAIERDPATRPMALSYLGQAQAQRGQTQAAAKAFRELLTEAPDSPEGTALRGAVRRSILQRAETRRFAQKPWSVFAAFSFGENSNVVGLSDAIPRPADITRTRSLFERIEPGARYNVSLSPSDVVTLGYDGRFDIYNDIGDRDVTNNALSADYGHLFGDRFGAGLRVSGDHATVDGKSFRDAVTVRPSAVARVRPWLSVELYASWTHADYRSPSQNPAVLDRDSDTTSAGGLVTMSVPHMPVPTQLQLGLARLDNDSVGSDFDFSGWQQSAAIMMQLPWQIGLDGYLQYAHYDYKSLNSLSSNNGPTAFQFEREDELTNKGLRMTRPVNEWVTVFGRYDGTRNGSNIAAYKYVQHIWLAGLAVRY